MCRFGCFAPGGCWQDDSFSSCQQHLPSVDRQLSAVPQERLKQLWHSRRRVKRCGRSIRRTRRLLCSMRFDSRLVTVGCNSELKSDIPLLSSLSLVAPIRPAVSVTGIFVPVIKSVSAASGSYPDGENNKVLVRCMTVPQCCGANCFRLKASMGDGLLQACFTSTITSASPHYLLPQYQLCAAVVPSAGLLTHLHPPNHFNPRRPCPHLE